MAIVVGVKSDEREDLPPTRGSGGGGSPVFWVQITDSEYRFDSVFQFINASSSADDPKFFQSSVRQGSRLRLR